MNRLWTAGLVLLLSVAIGAQDMASGLTPDQEEDFQRIHQSLTPAQRELLSRAVERFADRYGSMAGRVDPGVLLGEVTGEMTGGGVRTPAARFCVMVGAVRGLEGDLALLNRESAALEVVRGRLNEQVDRLRQMAGATGNKRDQGVRVPAEPPPGIRGAVSRTGPVTLSAPEAVSSTPVFRIPIPGIPAVSPLPETAGMSPVRIKALLQEKILQLERLNRSAQHLDAAIQGAVTNMSHLIQTMTNSRDAARDMQQATSRKGE